VSGQDIREVDAVARCLGMTIKQRAAFGFWLEEEKRHGERGTRNRRGDFTFEELLTKGEEFMEYWR
jgi:hypothetical protein